MTTYVFRGGKMVEKHLASPIPGYNAPYVISDNLPDTLRHMANGRYSDSKSEHRRWTKEAGCCEVGTSPLKPYTPPKLDRQQRARDIKTAIEQLRSR